MQAHILPQESSLLRTYGVKKVVRLAHGEELESCSLVVLFRVLESSLLVDVEDLGSTVLIVYQNDLLSFWPHCFF